MARSKKKDSNAVHGRKRLYENHLYREEPTTALKSNVGLTARILGTCCLGAAPTSTKSPVGVKPPMAGTWEDCPAFDLEPLPSRTGSLATSMTSPPRARKLIDGNRCGSQQSPTSRQVPLGEGDQGFTSGGALGCPAHAVAPPVLIPSSPTLSSAATGGGPNSADTLHSGSTPFATPGSGLTPTATTTATPAGGATTPPTQDSAAELYSDTDVSLQGGPESPSPSPWDRQTMQRRVALRMLERRGVLADGGSAAGGRSGGGGGGGGGTDRGGDAQACPGSSASGGGGALSSRSGSFPHLPVVSGAGGAVMLLSPPSGGRGGSEYQSATGSLTELPYESPVEVDERLCLQDDGAVADVDIDSSGGDMVSPTGPYGYRVSAPGLPGRRDAWGWQPEASCRPVSALRAIGVVGPESDGGDGVLRMRGSDFGGIVGGAAGRYPHPLQHRGPGRFGGSASHRTASLGVVDGGAASDDPRVAAVRASTGDAAVQTWSAAGGRVELSQEEKEWLFGQKGGIGGLAPVMALGEGGEGLVDLVRLDLPGRTLHLARKATRTFLPAYALSAVASGTGGTAAAAAAAALALGVRTSQTVSYRFPFEFFDREVKAMKVVKDSGFVIRFQAAAYDHDAGQGFILMEAAPYGTLEDLHTALYRSQLQPLQRQRPALLQRAIARLRFSSNAKASVPPFVSPSGAAGAAVAVPSAAGAADSPKVSPTGGGGAAVGDRPSIPRARVTPGGIGSCGGAALDAAEAEAAAAPGSTNERFRCCLTAATAVSVPYNGADAAAAAGGRTSSNAPGGGDGGGGGVAAAPTGAVGSCMGALGSSLMSTRALRYYGACMLQALVALHEAGYVYRDLKLSNVLVCDGGRVRLTDFGAAATCLPDQPGLFGGAAGTRTYLAPEVLPWLEAGAKGGGGGKRGGGGGAEPYTVTVDSWTWGLVMVELATGWSLKELTNRIIRRVCHPKASEPPDLPPDCGLPPALRQLLLDHVLIRDHRARWTAAKIRSHRFFEGLDWDVLAEVEGPHAHLFARSHALTLSGASTGPEGSPADVAAALLASEAAEAAGSRTSNRVTSTGVTELQVMQGGSSATCGGGGGSRVGPLEGGAPKATVGCGCSSLTVTPLGGGAGSVGGGGSEISSPMLLSPSNLVSYISPSSSVGGGSQRQSSAGGGGIVSGGGGARTSSPGGGLLIGPVVVGVLPGSPASSGASAGVLPAGGVVGGRRTPLGGMALGGSRLAAVGTLKA